MRFSILATLLTAIALSLFAADPSSTGFSQQSPIVFYHFVRGAAHLSRHADEFDQKNGSGKALRAAFAETTGLTDSDAQAFFEFAAKTEAQFAALDRQAAAVIAAAKAQSTADGLIPPPPSELTTLQTRKETLMTQLNAMFSESAVSEAGQAAVKRYLIRAAAHTNPVEQK